ncbi:MAG: hypothetical protein HY816_20130 [Candidatus Wallbacteria bacterium]|nr:hypothetical protein [Candidatus Wallbacteria bacterium]
MLEKRWGGESDACYDCEPIFRKAYVAKDFLRKADPPYPRWSALKRIKANELAIDSVRGWAQAVLSGENPGILILSGDVGRGKTELMRAAFRELALPKNPLKTKLEALVWVNEAEMFGMLTQAMASQDAGYREDAGRMRVKVNAMIDRAARAPVLFYDDLWVQGPSEWRDSILYRIFDSRWNPPRPTMITTNLQPAIGSGNFAERVSSRLYGQRPALTVGGPDWRMKR